MSPLPSVSFCGVRLNPLRHEEAIQAIEQFVAEKTPHQVCAANAYTITVAHENSEFYQVTNQASLVIPDGTSLVWFSRFLGIRIPERVAGPDLLESLCAIAEQKGYRFYFLGSTPEVLKKLVEVIRQRWPKLKVAGMHSPPMSHEFTEQKNAEIVSLINASHADILWVGLSAPKQDLWIAAHLSQLNVPACIGIGAAFNFLAGDIRRAPHWLRRIGFEWFYRLVCEPKRLWRRYLLGNAKFIWIVLNDFLKRCVPHSKTSPSNR